MKASDRALLGYSFRDLVMRSGRDEVLLRPAVLSRIVPFVAFAITISGCSEKAPVMKRMVRDDPIDEAYLREVFIPSRNGPGDKQALEAAVKAFNDHLSDFRAFMHEVELGRIKVTLGLKNDWASDKDELHSWYSASYYGREGSVWDFQKHKRGFRSSPLIYGFVFNKNGYLTEAVTLEDRLSFDEQGRVREYSHERR